jgi:hypothetical protein
MDAVDQGSRETYGPEEDTETTGDESDDKEGEELPAVRWDRYILRLDPAFFTSADAKWK